MEASNTMLGLLPRLYASPILIGSFQIQLDR